MTPTKPSAEAVELIHRIMDVPRFMSSDRKERDEENAALLIDQHTAAARAADKATIARLKKLCDEFLKNAWDNQSAKLKAELAKEGIVCWEQTRAAFPELATADAKVGDDSEKTNNNKGE